MPCIPRRSSPIRARSSSWISWPRTSSRRWRRPRRRVHLQRTPGRPATDRWRRTRYTSRAGCGADLPPALKSRATTGESTVYRAPLREMRFVLEELLGAGSLGAHALLADYSDELARSVLEEAARFAEGVLAPLNRPGATHGARWTADGVVTAPGFREAYQQFVAGGWPGPGPEPQFGGQRGPRGLVGAVGGVWGAACPALKLGSMLPHR